MPASKSVDIEKLPDIALECMNDAKFPVLATVGNNQPRVRPVSPVKLNGSPCTLPILRNMGKQKKLKTIQKSNFVTLPRITIKFESLVWRNLFLTRMK